MTKDTAGGDKPTAESLLGELEAAIVSDAIDARYAGLIDENHPVLSVEEQLAALKKADLAVTAERKKAAIADLQKRGEQSLRGTIGQTTGDVVRDEPTWITLDLAEHSDRITLNMVQYFHGQTYKVPRHVADTLREIQSRGWNHQLEIEGRGLADRYRQPQNRVLSGGEAA